jgi:hypothetical protein
VTRKLIEHLVSILLVAGVFVALILSVQKNPTRQLAPTDNELQHYLALDFLDFGSPLDKALFKETLDAFFPERTAHNDSLMLAIERLRREQFTSEFYKTGGDKRGLTTAKLQSLALMYLKFIVIYLVVMALCYYGAQTIGVVRFFHMKQGASSYLASFVAPARTTESNDKDVRSGGRVKFGQLSTGVGRTFSLLAKAIVKGVAYMVLFSPAYVIAYSFKTKFDTDSYLFVVILGVVSNGLLINYANKFFTLLVSESRKGYVETAVAKNLHNAYQWDAANGTSFNAVLRFNKIFPSHVFQHIYLNAHYQFVPTLKEFASFLITGLVIIEMALNIQGHLSYEMLKNILFRQYDVVLAIILGMFLLVKATEIVVDVWMELLVRKYENRGT